MKKGDVVVIDDGSYSRSIINGKSVHESRLGDKNEQFVVVEVDCKFPVVDDFQPRYESEPRFNNTVIQAVSSGKVISIEERFLELVLPVHKIMVDMRQLGGMISGQIVEISDKLYKEITK